jgi:spermidine/putrescine transport system permease protein
VITVIVLSFNDSRVVGLPFRGFTWEWFIIVFTRPELVRRARQQPAARRRVGHDRNRARDTARGSRSGGHFPATNVIFYLDHRADRAAGRRRRRHPVRFLRAPENPAVACGQRRLVAHVSWVLPFSFLSLYPVTHRFDRSLEESRERSGRAPHGSCSGGSCCR